MVRNEYNKSDAEICEIIVFTRSVKLHGTVNSLIIICSQDDYFNVKYLLSQRNNYGKDSKFLVLMLMK
jgi:hypothetical protein